MMLQLRLPLAVAFAGTAITLLALSASSLHAQTYMETGDAGTSPAGAQGTGVTAGQALNAISGTLTTTGDADFYLLSITNPALFSATTVGGTAVDTQVFLFTLSGAPIYLNDDEASGASSQSLLPAGSPLGPQSAGTYILGVSVSGVDPVNSTNQTLFAPANFSTDLRGPASNTFGTVSGVIDNSSFADSGPYSISLTGATTAVPEPGTTALLAAGAFLGFVTVRRRRRDAVVVAR